MKYWYVIIMWDVCDWLFESSVRLGVGVVSVSECSALECEMCLPGFIDYE